MIDPGIRQQVYDDLGTQKDIAEALDVNIFRMRRWIERRARTQCPRPIKRFAHTDVYSIEEWKVWFEQWVSTRQAWAKGTKPYSGSGKPFFTFGLSASERRRRGSES